MRASIAKHLGSVGRALVAAVNPRSAIAAKAPKSPATRSLRRFRLVAAGAIVSVACITAFTPVARASSSKHFVTLSPLTLGSETIWMNPHAPSSCLAEDDYVQRQFYGSLSGTFTTSETLCDNVYSDGTYWNSGGIGLQMSVYVEGTLSDMTISAPTGATAHAVLIGSSTSKGKTIYHYETCFVPPYSISTDISTDPLSLVYQGDMWTLTLSGNIASATLETTGTMTGAVFQQNNCPPSEQNLTP